MPYEVSWLQQDRVIYIHFSGHTTVRDLEQAYRLAQRMRDCGVEPVYTIVNVQDVVSHPTDLRQLQQLFSRRSGRDEGWIVLVGGSRNVRFVSTALANFGGQRMTCVRSMRKAFAFLKGHDPTLQLETRSQPAGG